MSRQSHPDPLTRHPGPMRVDLMATPMPLARMQALARDAAAAGFSGLVITEAGRTAYLGCAAAALAAPELDILTGVAVAFPRSPMVTAQVAWELADATGGRFRLGLGTQVRAHVERRYGMEFDPPGPRMRDYVLALKAIFKGFRGEPLDYTATTGTCRCSRRCGRPAPSTRPTRRSTSPP